MNVQGSKFTILTSSVAGTIPTIPTVADHKSAGWIDLTDIYEGELFLNTADKVLYTRAGNDIVILSGDDVLALNNLTDVLIAGSPGPTDGDILTYSSGTWSNGRVFDGVLNVDETLRSVYQETCTLGALAANSFAEGFHTNVSGSYGHAEGSGTDAAGDYSHAEGQNTNADGSVSHAEGSQTTATGTKSHAEGDRTVATGAVSHSSGGESIALRDYQYAHGGGKIATVGDAQFCRIVYKIQTTDATATTIATFDTERGHIYGCRILAIGVGSGGAGTGMVSVYGGHNSNDPNSFGYIKNLSGEASTSFSKIYEAPHGSGSDAEFPGADSIGVIVSGTDILFQVTGAASNTINWVLTLEWTETII